MCNWNVQKHFIKWSLSKVSNKVNGRVNTREGTCYCCFLKIISCVSEKWYVIWQSVFPVGYMSFFSFSRSCGSGDWSKTTISFQFQCFQQQWDWLSQEFRVFNSPYWIRASGFLPSQTMSTIQLGFYWNNYCMRQTSDIWWNISEVGNWFFLIFASWKIFDQPR